MRAPTRAHAHAHACKDTQHGRDHTMCTVRARHSPPPLPALPAPAPPPLPPPPLGSPRPPHAYARPMHMPTPCICPRGARAVHARSGRAHRPARTQHALVRPCHSPARPSPAPACHVPVTRRMDPHPSLASLSLQRSRLRCTAHCHVRRRAGGVRGLGWRSWGRVHVCGAEGRVGARRQAVSRWACVKARPLPRDSSPPPTPPLHTQAGWPWGGGGRRPARVCGL